jgi:hypothetical protein
MQLKYPIRLPNWCSKRQGIDSAAAFLDYACIAVA